MQSVAIFWDYESCSTPSSVSGYELSNSIRSAAQKYGPIRHFKAYLQASHQTRILRSELQCSAVSLTVLPHGKISCLALVVDMMTFAMDHPAPWTFVLITGDKDFAFVVATLRLRGYDIVLISPSMTDISLTTQATDCLDWSTIIGGKINPSAQLNPVAMEMPSPQHEPTWHADPSPRPSDSRTDQKLSPAFSDPTLPDLFPGSMDSLAGSKSSSASSTPSTPDSRELQKQLTSEQSFPTMRRLLNTSQDPVWKYQEALFAENPAVPPKTSQYPAVLHANKEIPAEFLPLAHVLETYRLRGIHHPLRTMVASDIARNKDVRPGLPEKRPFKKYARLAQEAGMIYSGGDGDTQWLSLHPTWHGRVF